MNVGTVKTPFINVSAFTFVLLTISATVLFEKIFVPNAWRLSGLM
jgi:hypothetical protein